MDEAWKDIQGFEGLYQINNFGIVKSLDREVFRYGHKMTIKGKYIKIQNQFRVSGGYPYYILCKEGKNHIKKIHRLMAIHFLEKKDGKDIVNHKDGNKENFQLDNLEWCDLSYNSKHNFKIGLQKRKTGSDNHNTKISDEEIIKIIKEFKEKKCSGKELYMSKYSNIIGYQHYLDICNGRKRKEIFNMVNYGTKQ